MMDAAKIIEAAWDRSSTWDFDKNGPMRTVVPLQYAPARVTDAGADVVRNEPVDVVTFRQEPVRINGGPGFHVIGSYKGVERVVKIWLA